MRAEFWWARSEILPSTLIFLGRYLKMRINKTRVKVRQKKTEDLRNNRSKEARNERLKKGKAHWKAMSSEGPRQGSRMGGRRQRHWRNVRYPVSTWNTSEGKKERKGKKRKSHWTLEQEQEAVWERKSAMSPAGSAANSQHSENNANTNIYLQFSTPRKSAQLNWDY